MVSKWSGKGATAVVEHGANPGLISHFTKQGLMDIASQALSEGKATGSDAEQIRQHIWVSTQPMEEPERGGHLLDIMEWVGWDRILFASDYPHWDFDDARSAMPGVIPAERRAAIYGGNARALYRL